MCLCMWHCVGVVFLLFLTQYVVLFIVGIHDIIVRCVAIVVLFSLIHYCCCCVPGSPLRSQLQAHSGEGWYRRMEAGQSPSEQLTLQCSDVVEAHYFVACRYQAN